MFLFLFLFFYFVEVTLIAPCSNLCFPIFYYILFVSTDIVRLVYGCKYACECARANDEKLLYCINILFHNVFSNIG